MSFLVSKPEQIRRWVSEKFIVEGLRELELLGGCSPPLLRSDAKSHIRSALAFPTESEKHARGKRKIVGTVPTNEASCESIAHLARRDIMNSYLPDSSLYELLTVIVGPTQQDGFVVYGGKTERSACWVAFEAFQETEVGLATQGWQPAGDLVPLGMAFRWHCDAMGKGFEDLMTVNLARHKPSGEFVTVRRINLEACTNEMVAFLQDELHVSKFFSNPNLVPYKAAFVVSNELWVVTSFMAYGSAKDLICTHFMDGMSELAMAYILQGILKALDYIHHMGYVHRSVKASHVLISADGKVYLSGLRSNLSMIRHGQRLKVVHDFPKFSIKGLPWLSPEVLQQNLQGYDAKSDIYSVGITACELANGHVPFKDMPVTQMLLEKLNGTVPCLLDTTTIPPEELTTKPLRSGASMGFMENTAANNAKTSNGDAAPHPYLRTFSPSFHHFVEQCLHRNPELRPSASALLNHSFFKQIKRRPSEALPELLYPVTPMTSFEGLQAQDPSSISGAESNLEQLKLDDWEF